MERSTRVSVYESDNPSEIQLVKSKLDDAQIANTVENNYLTFTTTPTATSLAEGNGRSGRRKRAFEIIDAYLQQSENQ